VDYIVVLLQESLEHVYIVYISYHITYFVMHWSMLFMPQVQYLYTIYDPLGLKFNCSSNNL